ncbi:DUF3891 family protein [Ornithinibacillus halophilus]|uniref:DUF3891 family protein n=1 Tax=Ornithinibacillus halophilus TaxID=930117 RepID=A0A1M5DXV6_9BACI|nr:DUF3891 family protein [Ornithinibacillus halophilus]SHF71642.1 Protein of unknown function [Ornithinibacillus halophilus]
MIIRERDQEFVMIEQHNHGQVSGDIMSKWKESMFIEQSHRRSVEFAIYNHDLGWNEFDQQPFWDDKDQKPYSFSTFPTLPKIILYKHGIEEVEKEDPYAGLLCSEHYSRFLANNTSIPAQEFVRSEKERQQKLWKKLQPLDKRSFNFHYGLVQLGDNLSLYLCLNEPGINKENEHPFFKSGIPLNSALIGFQESTLQLRWKNSSTVEIHEFPFKSSFHVRWKEKVVKKQLIQDVGLLEAYATTPFETREVQFVPK